MSEREISQQSTEFFERLSRLDSGDRARLRRSAGKPPIEAPDALGLFYRLLPAGVADWQESLYFLVATLFPLVQGGGAGNLGSSLRRAQRADNQKGLDRRMEVLLDADERQLPFRLRQAVKYLASSRVRVDWPKLLEDLLWWTHPKRFIQQAWARSYFGD